MRWRGRRQSSNVEDRRLSPSRGGGKVAAGGGLGAIVLIVVVALMGGDIRPLLERQQAQVRNAPAAGASRKSLSADEVEAGEFVATVLADSEEVWSEIFRTNRQFSRRFGAYRKPTLVLFSESTDSACGFASAATGPFYCPADEKVFIDTSFFDQLARQLGAPGDFAQAYVIAHEVGHHVQNLMGTTDYVSSLRNQLSKTEYNKYSVKLELQADFFAGVMLHHADKKYNIIQRGDVAEAMRAAQAIGDDTLQRRSQGYVVPESFSHGTSEQRLYWLTRGLDTGDVTLGDTFGS